MIVQKRKVALRYQRRWIFAPLLLTIAVIAAMFRGGGSLYWGPLESDLTNQFYPWRVFIHRWFARGVFPFWDPHIFSGYPTVETQQMLALNPVHLFTLWMPPNIGLATTMALNTLIACMGMYWALRRWGRSSRMAAGLGAGIFTFGALFAVRVMAGHFTVVAALAWWPVAAMSVLKLSRSIPATACPPSTFRKSLGNIVLSAKSVALRRIVVLSAVFHTMVFLAGAPQYIVYLFYIDLAILAASARHRALLSALVATAVAWVLALVLSTPQWLPAFWYLPYTGRALSSSGATGWNTRPLFNVGLETLLPFPFGDDLNFGHLHFKNVWETALYPGGLSLILTLAMFLCCAGWLLRRALKRSKTIASITPLGLAGILVVVIGLYMMAGGWLPGFGGFREPLKARAVVAFGIAMIGAAAFDGIARHPVQWRIPLGISTAVMFCLIAASLSYAHPTEFLNLIKSFGSPMDPLAGNDYMDAMKDPAAAISRFRFAGLYASASATIALLFLLVLRRKSEIALTVLFLVALGDPFGANAPAWLARHAWSRAGIPKPIADYFKPRLESGKTQLPFRVVLNSGIINRTHHIEGLYEYYGYDPLMPALAVGHMLVKGLDNRANADRSKLLEKIGVRYDVRDWMGTHPINDDTSPSQILTMPDASLYGVSRDVAPGSPGVDLFGPDMSGTNYVLPAKLAGPVGEEAAEPSQEFQSTIAAAFPPGDNNSGLSSDESIASVNTGRPDEWTVRLKLERPALLTFKSNWLPGWHTWIDGKDKGRSLFANNWMCGAIILDGEHEVTFRYRPVAWTFSIVAMIIGLLAVALIPWKFSRK